MPSLVIIFNTGKGLTNRRLRTVTASTGRHRKKGRKQIPVPRILVLIKNIGQEHSHDECEPKPPRQTRWPAHSCQQPIY